MTDELHDFLRTRRSVRRFKTDPVPDSVVQRILTTATFAPSAHNRQPWRFAIVNNTNARMKLATALTTKMRGDMQAEDAPDIEIEKRVTRSLCRIEEAPVLILLCRDVTDVRIDTPEETIMGIQSVAAAGMQLLLAAHAEGLGANWICWPLYAKDETRTALGLLDTWEPQAMYFIGYPIKTTQQSERKPINEVAITIAE